MVGHTYSAALAFRAATKASIRAPVNKRFFTPSAINMVKKAYFDLQWTGPVVKVDADGNVTSKSGAEGKSIAPWY